MESIEKIKRDNAKIAQLKMILYTVLMKKEQNMEFIFEKIDNVNSQVVATEYMQLHHKKWIGYTILHFAADGLYTTAFEVLLKLGADITLKNNNGSTALHQIAENNPESFDVYTRSLVSEHVRCNNFENPLNNSGLSHFHIACASNNVEVVEGFLNSGVIVDLTVKMDSTIFPGFSPLHFAAKYCALEVVEVLLSHSASIRIKDARGMTPVHVALDRKLKSTCEDDSDEIQDNKIEKILEIFLEKESFNDMMIIDDWGLSYFHIACALNGIKVAECLLQKVVNINHYVNMDSPLWPGYTALHFAALCNIEIVKLLMKKGADISVKNGEGDTPLDICIKRYKTEDIHAILCLDSTYKDILLSDGRTKVTDLVFAMRNSNQFDVFLKNLSEDCNFYQSPIWSGYSLMHLVVRFIGQSFSAIDANEDTNVQILKKLCRQTPNVLYNKDFYDYTPLHLAFRLKKKPAISRLLYYLGSHPSLIDHTDKDGLSYLHIASAKNDTHVLQRLLAMGTNVNAVYKGKLLDLPMIYPDSTALHFAVANKSIDAVEVLVNFDADLYAKNAIGMTPVHLILWNENERLARILLGTPNLKDSVVHDIGLNHLHVACLYGKPEHVESLLDNGADINAVVTYDSKENSNEFAFLEKYAGHSLLLLAYERGKHDIVKVLLQRGAKVFVDHAREMSTLYKTFELKFKDPSDSFTDILEKSVDLQTRFKDDTGITELHIACFNWNIVKVKKLISEGVDVDAQVRFDSPIFPGYTALHVLTCIGECRNENDVNELTMMFVENGADVTLQTANSETVIHMVYKIFNATKGDSNYRRLSMLLRAQRNFSLNPTSIEGISHFHIACSLCNIDIVEKFLNQADIDVDQPIDYFSPDLAGYSALHLAAEYQPGLRGSWEQLYTIDLLLKKGANVHVADVRADTPLHVSARFEALDVFERLIRAGARVNARNIRYNTPLYYYLGSANTSIQEIKTLLRFGCHLNDFDGADDEGYLGLTVSNFRYGEVVNFLYTAIVNFRQQLEMDGRGRTVIHNVVSIDTTPPVFAYQYVEMIDILSKIGCDVDDQDQLGRTALHMAAQFCNFNAVSGLLMAGADINITDIDGDTVFAYRSGMCEQCLRYAFKVTVGSDNEDEEDNDLCEHLQTINTLSIHVKKLRLCGLEVSKKNEDMVCDAFEKYANNTSWSEKFSNEFESIKSIKIASHSLTLGDFISESRAVADYPTMSQVKREDINKFFSSPGEVDSLRNKFPEIAGILQLQYRKTRARPQLLESAKNALVLLIGFRLPEICSDFILVLLTNTHLKNLIASATQ